MPKIKDITGQRFGRLTALKFLGRSSYKQSLWLCACDCGKAKEIVAYSLRKGLTGASNENS